MKSEKLVTQIMKKSGSYSGTVDQYAIYTRVLMGINSKSTS